MTDDDGEVRLLLPWVKQERSRPAPPAPSLAASAVALSGSLAPYSDVSYADDPGILRQYQHPLVMSTVSTTPLDTTGGTLGQKLETRSFRTFTSAPLKASGMVMQATEDSLQSHFEMDVDERKGLPYYT